MSNSNGVMIQSVVRATEILQCFSSASTELGIKEISNNMGLSKSTIYGLVNTLTACGFLEQNIDSKKYRLGIKLFELGMQVYENMDLRNEAKPYCEALSLKHDSTVHLAANYSDKIVYVDKVNAPSAPIVYSQVGKNAPFYCTGVGKAVASYLSDADLKKLIEKTDIRSFTSKTITDVPQLKKEFEMTRRRGYSIDNEEIEWGLYCVAAPIFNHLSFPIAAVSISGPKIKLSNLKLIATDVRHTALEISIRMGYRP